ncbi:MAG: hypothetical protein JO020_08125 [Chloroflexi bacterium]|nr:hypothetical protein [Chloroflexota bacterium]MBV9894121.1 hypothetical protein [Chloroflexota bacterium]
MIELVSRCSFLISSLFLESIEHPPHGGEVRRAKPAGGQKSNHLLASTLEVIWIRHHFSGHSAFVLPAGGRD